MCICRTRGPVAGKLPDRQQEQSWARQGGSWLLLQRQSLDTGSVYSQRSPLACRTEELWSHVSNDRNVIKSRLLAREITFYDSVKDVFPVCQNNFEES